MKIEAHPLVSVNPEQINWIEFAKSHVTGKFFSINACSQLSPVSPFGTFKQATKYAKELEKIGKGCIALIFNRENEILYETKTWRG